MMEVIESLSFQHFTSTHIQPLLNLKLSTKSPQPAPKAADNDTQIEGFHQETNYVFLEGVNWVFIGSCQVGGTAVLLLMPNSEC